MQGDGDGDCAAGESSGSEGGAERSGKVNLAAVVLLVEHRDCRHAGGGESRCACRVMHNVIMK